MAEESFRWVSKAELIDKIRQDRVEFTGLWAGLTPEQMIRRPGPQSDWSVKDLIAHLIFWENLMVGNIHKLLAGEIPPAYQDYDAINAGVFEANKDRILDDVLTEWASNQANVEAAIDRLTEDQFNRPGIFAWRDGSPLLYHIVGNTFGHLGDHRPDLLRYVESLKG